MRQLLDVLGNPQERYAIVHVAGTKGKGTTATLLAACLNACGKRTGLYTSPHLLRLEERIRFQGESCSPADLVDLTHAVRSAALQLEAKGVGLATFFEMTTAMGLLHFANCRAEVVVLEVGLGGRLDSTNVCSPVVSVITSISLDHQAQLGDTLPLIAREKAGIVKFQTPVVCSARAADAAQVIAEVAEGLQAPLELIGRDFEVDWQVESWQGDSADRQATVAFRTLDRRGLQLSTSDWSTRLLGRHQADNIGAALATVEVLQNLGWHLPRADLELALAQVQPPARLQIVGSDPVLIIDSAHNPASIDAGLQALEDHFPHRKRTTLFAASRDKDWSLMLRSLLRSSKRVILTAYQKNPRALPMDELFEEASRIVQSLRDEEGAAELPSIETAQSPEEAWQLASQQTDPAGLVYATGSFFLAAELLAVPSLAAGE